MLIVQSIYKSEFDKNFIVSFHIANSEKYVQLLKKNDMLFLYGNEKIALEKDKYNFEQQMVVDYKSAGRKLVNEFSDYHYDYILKKEKGDNDKKEFIWGNFILKNRFEN